MGDVELALATAQEAFDLCQDADSGFHSSEAAVELARGPARDGPPGAAPSSCSSAMPAARSWR